MKIIFIVLWIIVLLASATGLVYLAKQKFVSSSIQKLFFSVPILVVVLFGALLISATYIPQKMDVLLSKGISYVETNINLISPEYTNQVLDADKAKTLINDTKTMKVAFDNDVKANFLVKMVGVNAYIDYLSNFVDDIETNFAHFEKEQIPFTLHNIFDFLRQKTKAPIIVATRVIQICLLVVAFIVNILNLALLFYFSKEQKNKLATREMLDRL